MYEVVVGGAGRLRRWLEEVLMLWAYGSGRVRVTITRAIFVVDQSAIGGDRRDGYLTLFQSLQLWKSRLGC